MDFLTGLKNPGERNTSKAIRNKYLFTPHSIIPERNTNLYKCFNNNFKYYVDLM